MVMIILQARMSWNSSNREDNWMLRILVIAQAVKVRIFSRLLALEWVGLSLTLSNLQGLKVLSKLVSPCSNSIRGEHPRRIQELFSSILAITKIFHKTMLSISNQCLIKITIQLITKLTMTPFHIRARISVIKMELKSNYKVWMDRAHMDFSCIKFQAKSEGSKWIVPSLATILRCKVSHQEP